MHTACLAQRNQDLLVRPHLSELLSTLPFSDISSYGSILALGEYQTLEVKFSSRLIRPSILTHSSMADAIFKNGANQ